MSVREKLAGLALWQKILLGLVGAGVLGFVGFILVVLLYPVPEPNDDAVGQVSTVYYSDGQTQVGTFGEIRRVAVPLAQVPEHVQLAVMAAEDRAFYDHGGFSITGIGRALWNNLTGGSTQGGSTITQQFVKNTFLTQERTVTRKIKELILSVKLEMMVSKEDILEGYLNTIYWGRGAYGIQAASQAYFGVDSDELDVAQGIALAGMIRSPNNYEPTKNPEGLQKRFDYVRDGMVEEGWLTQSEARQLEMPEFIEPKGVNSLGGQTGHIIEQAKRELIAAGFDEAEVAGGGMKIVTTIDEQGQEDIENAVATAGPQSNTEGLRLGVIAINPQTGGIIAMYGGPDYVEDQFNTATQGRSQPGSTFKPFGLIAAFEQNIGLGSVWNGNSPRTISGYTLRNEGNRSWGDITLQTATDFSVNTVFVDVEATTGVGPVIDAAVDAGIPANTPNMARDLTFVLGTSSPRTVDVASAYATFANRGVYHEPTILQQVTDAFGDVLYEDQDEGEQRFDANTMDVLNWSLQRVVTQGTATGAQAIGRPSAGKTGTTDDNKSAWYAGYTPQMAVAVSMSKEDENGRQVTLRGTGGLAKVTGGSFPVGIWTAFARPYLQGKEVIDFVFPAQFPGGGEPIDEEPEPEESESESPEPEESESEEPEPTEEPEPEPTESEPTESPGPPEPTEPPGPTESPGPPDDAGNGEGGEPGGG